MENCNVEICIFFFQYCVEQQPVLVLSAGVGPFKRILLGSHTCCAGLGSMCVAIFMSIAFYPLVSQGEALSLIFQVFL